MAEYIEREAALKAIDEYFHTTNPDGEEQIGVLKSRRIIRTFPAADVEVVKHGRWIPLEYDGYADGNPVWDLWECSKCQEEHSGDEDTLTPYCPHCGCKMDLEVTNGLDQH